MVSSYEIIPTELGVTHATFIQEVRTCLRLPLRRDCDFMLHLKTLNVGLTLVTSHTQINVFCLMSCNFPWLHLHPLSWQVKARAPHRDQVSGPDVEGGGIVEVPVILQSSDLQNARRI